MKKKKVKLISSICLALFICYLIFKPKGIVFNIKDFDVDEVVIGDITKTITANGPINPVNVIDVGAQVSGKIEKIYVDYNDVVKKNQKLAEIDTSILEKEVGEARSTMKKAEADLELSKLNYQRNFELYKNNYIAKVELDQAETELKNKQEEYNIRKSQYERAQINLGYAIITSPVSGVVISREIDVGQTVASSFSAPTLFKIAEDLTKMQIETSVSEADIGSVKEGLEVDFTVDAFPKRTFQGKIRQVRLNPTTESNVVVYNVVIEINNEDKSLMPGMTAYVTIPIAEVFNVKKINNVAFRFSPTDEILNIMGIKKKPERQQGKLILYKIKDEKKKIIEPIYVTIGISNLSQVEIESDELEEGDKIITNSIYVAMPPKKNNRR